MRRLALWWLSLQAFTAGNRLRELREQGERFGVDPLTGRRIFEQMRKVAVLERRLELARDSIS